MPGNGGERHAGSLLDRGKGRRRLVTLLVASALWGLSCAAPPTLVGRTPLGERVELLGAATGPVVLLFVAPDCPISNRYAPTLSRLFEEFSPRGVRFYRVYADPALVPEATRRHGEEFALPLPALWDPEQRLAAHTGVSVTPEAAVLGADGELLYRGRIDDRYLDFGLYRQRATREDLRQALGAALEGEPAPEPWGRAVGCYLPPPPPVEVAGERAES